MVARCAMRCSTGETETDAASQVSHRFVHDQGFSQAPQRVARGAPCCADNRWLPEPGRMKKDSERARATRNQRRFAPTSGIKSRGRRTLGSIRLGWGRRHWSVPVKMRRLVFNPSRGQLSAHRLARGKRVSRLWGAQWGKHVGNADLFSLRVGAWVRGT